MSSQTLKTAVTALITLFVVGVMAAGVLTSHDVGIFEQFGTLVIGYWFGAGAQEAVTRAKAGHDGGNVPSVL